MTFFQIEETEIGLCLWRTPGGGQATGCYTFSAMRRFYLSLPIVVTNVILCGFQQGTAPKDRKPHQEGSQRTNANPRRAISLIWRAALAGVQ